MNSEEEIVNITFGDVGMYLPRSIEAIQTARKLLDMLEAQLKPQIRSESDSACNRPDRGAVRPQGEIGTGKETTSEVYPTAQKQIDSFQIPKFAWDKTKEKSYDKLFFFEHEDGRVLLSYSNGRFYTTKAAVMRIPFPIPWGYELLKELSTNNRTAVRAYRKYLSEMGADTIHIDCASAHALTEREKKLKEAAEINAARWKPQKEMSARTKELRDGVVARMVLGVGAEKKD